MLFGYEFIKEIRLILIKEKVIKRENIILMKTEG